MTKNDTHIGNFKVFFCIAEKNQPILLSTLFCKSKGSEIQKFIHFYNYDQEKTQKIAFNLFSILSDRKISFTENCKKKREYKLLYFCILRFTKKLAWNSKNTHFELRNARIYKEHCNPKTN